MARVKKIDSKEVGLDIGLLIFKFFLQSENLHYGYWTPDLEHHAGNLRAAQENYSAFLFSHIPPGTKTILDVGAGSGIVAKKLIEMGYEVTCICPSKMLSARIKENIGDKGIIHTATFQNAEGLKTYDLILFCESFQYIPMEYSFGRCPELLNPGGTILLCDFFQRDGVPGKSPLGGGHPWAAYEKALAASIFKTEVDVEITQETAPTMTCVNDLSLQVIKPMYFMLLRLLEDRMPWVYKFVTWKFKKKMEKLEAKHFAGERNAANFIKYKDYRLIRLGM